MTESTGRAATRRDVLRSVAVVAAGASFGALASSAAAQDAKPAEVSRESSSRAGSAQDPWQGLKAGVASYSLRGLKLDAAIKAIQRVDLKYVSIKDIHLKMDSTPEQRKAVVQQFRDAGITPLSCGVVTLENDEEKVRRAFEYTRDIGAAVMVCSPDPEAFPLLDRMVKSFDIKLAIHNHGPGDKRFPSPYDALKAAEKFDPRIGLCIDVGHTARAGVDPAEAIRKCRERLYDLHLKDVDPSLPQPEVELGRGRLDVRAILQALLDVRYAHHVGFEHEKDAKDPLPGLAESVGYAKGMLSGMRPTSA
jgi:sugar phosphate isomerase/epimerase